MAKIGYIRVSTNDQNTDLQRKTLVCANCEQIFEDKISGKTVQRPGLQRVLKHLQRGDTLVVWKLDRLGRSVRHLITQGGIPLWLKIAQQPIFERYSQ